MEMLEMLIKSPKEGMRYEAFHAVGQGYKLILFNLYPKSKVIMNAEGKREVIMNSAEVEVIGWGLVPYYVHTYTSQSILNSLRGELGGSGGEESFGVYFESYFELCRNRVKIDQGPLLSAKSPSVEDFVPSHVVLEAKEYAKCCQYIKAEKIYQEGLDKFFQSYVKYVNGKAAFYESKSRVIGFYLKEIGVNPYNLSRKEYGEFFKTTSLSWFFSDASVVNVRRDIRGDTLFQPSDYDASKVKYKADYSFAMLLI